MGQFEDENDDEDEQKAEETLCDTPLANEEPLC
jgi:hypothetical protein